MRIHIVIGHKNRPFWGDPSKIVGAYTTRKAANKDARERNKKAELYIYKVKSIEVKEESEKENG